MSRFDYSILAASDEDSNQVKMPAYQFAADSHNYGNGNFAITDPSTWGEGLGNAGKFIIAAAASGANSFYNTGIAVGNWLGAEGEQNDIATQLSALDDDLGKYYKDNRDSVDLAGFIVGSLVPGLAGVKLLNAGQKVLRTAQQTGMIGGNLSRVTGLLTPAVKANTTLAAAEIAQSSAAFSMTTGNALRAIGAGYGQAALEAAAFEIAVGATMFKSPVLEDMDGWDIAKNMLVGTAVGGVIGGAINHAITYGTVKGAVKTFNQAEKQFADVSDLRGLSDSQQIIARTEQLSTLPEVPAVAQILDGSWSHADKLLKDLTVNQQQVVAEQLVGKLTRLRAETKNSLELANRASFQALAKNDSSIANSLSDLTLGLPGNQALANMESLTEIGRVGSKLKAEDEINAFIKKQATGQGITNILNSVLGEGVLPKKIGYVKLNGENIGQVSFDAPKVLGLGDTYKTPEEILNAVKGYKFNEGKVWSAMESTHTEAEARYIWAEKAAVKDGMKIGEHDIPLLERAAESRLSTITVVSKAGNYEISTSDDLLKHLQVSKQEAASQLLQGNKAGTGVTVEEIAKITNVRTSFLEGELSQDVGKDLFARQAARADYIADLEAKGFSPNEIARKAETYYAQPTYIKAAYDTTVMGAVDAYEVTGMAYIKAQQKIYQMGIDNVAAKHIPEDMFNRFWHPGDDMMLKTNRFGAGPGMFSFANGGYHTPESWAEAIGSATSGLQKHYKEITTTQLQSTLHKIVSNEQVALEFESINKHLMSTNEAYGINATGNAIVPLKVLDYEAAIKEGKKVTFPTLQEGAPLSIPFKHPETLEAWSIRAQLNGDRTTAFQEIRNAQGLTDMKDARALRPIRHDPKDYPFYAVVVDPAITGVGHKSMIHAASAKELEAMIAKVPPNYKTLKGDQLKDYFKANGEFDFEMTLHENYIDADLKRSGVNNPFFMRTDPQKIAQSFLQDHLRSDDIFARELVNAKFEKEFSFLRKQGEQYTSTATSKYTGSFRDIENSVKNPYLNYVKTALNVSQASEHPLWMGLNQKLDYAVSKVWNTITETASKAKTVEELAETNRLLVEFGVKSAYYDAATTLLANHSAPKGVLVNFVGKANTMISTLVTRLDPLNAINNAVGSTILYGSELKSFLRAMGTDDTELAGKLSGLLKTPRASEGLLNAETAGSVEQVTNAGKIMQNAIKNWFDKEAKTASGVPLKDYYKANGWSTKLGDQARQMMEDLTLVGNESASIMSEKLNNAFKNFKVLVEKGEKYTGNKYAEEFNRFVSADSMRQLTDLGIQAGKITEQEALGYINTFVNRTQGNILASQRPLMFQGAVGQAVGLFQSYQFNLMQQLFRHVSEGQGKDAAMLLGLQGTMYGMNGLPGFNYLNQHIVGTMSGNPKHTDAYSATYGIAGKSVGDLLLYGLPSNLLRANLYTRGDINPRQVTVVPTNPLDIPFVSATMKAYDNVSTTLNRMANGGAVWQTLLQGIEHNGISRPLAGLAQVTQAATHQGMVFSTTKKGSISGVNDLFSWSTAARLAGGKPFDEAIANDQVFRITAYQAADRAKLEKLNGAIRTNVIAGGTLEGDEYTQLAAKYAAIGGKQHNFNKYMIEQIKKANTSKANQIMENMKHPYSQKMQQVMGGEPGLDGNTMYGSLGVEEE